MELYFITFNWAWTSVKKTDSSSIHCRIFKWTNNICQKFILAPFIKWNTQVCFYFINLLTGLEHLFKRLTHINSLPFLLLSCKGASINRVDSWGGLNSSSKFFCHQKSYDSLISFNFRLKNIIKFQFLNIFL